MYRIVTQRDETTISDIVTTLVIIDSNFTLTDLVVLEDSAQPFLTLNDNVRVYRDSYFAAALVKRPKRLYSDTLPHTDVGRQIHTNVPSESLQGVQQSAK